MKNFFVLLFTVMSFNLVASEELEIKNARARLVPPNSPATAIFLSITNHSNKEIKLIKASGDFAGKFELHTMEMTGAKMVMRAVDSISIKSHATVELGPGGLHIMVFKLKSPLKIGNEYKLELLFDNNKTATVMTKVERF